MTASSNKLGEAIDRLDSVAHSLLIPLSNEVHINVVRTILPEIVHELRLGFIGVTGENPWEEVI